MIYRDQSDDVITCFACLYCMSEHQSPSECFAVVVSLSLLLNSGVFSSGRPTVVLVINIPDSNCISYFLPVVLVRTQPVGSSPVVCVVVDGNGLLKIPEYSQTKQHPLHEGSRP